MSADLLLVLDKRDMLVRLEGKALRVERPGGALQRVPLGMLGMVVVHGAPAVTCDVWRALAERFIPAVLVPLRTQGTAWLGAGLSTAIQVRCRQHEVARDPAATLAVARQWLRLKLAMQRQLLAVLPPPLNASPTGEIRAALESGLAALVEVEPVAALMGVEGAAAAAWYGWLAAHLPAPWTFTGRNRRPPRDPVNALLSLGYTLLGAEMLSAVQEAGLDPALGFLHGIVPGRESLVLDLIEPLRPGVDALVLRLLNQVVTPAHFTRHPVQGCRLNKEGRGLFYPAWAHARRYWPLPLAPDAGLGAWTAALGPTAISAEAQVDQSLRIQCRRMIRVLRSLLRAPDDAAGDEEGETDG
jgi:CRISPR-associated protein Cas1